MNLERYDAKDFDRGRPIVVEVLWLLVQELFVNTWLPGSMLRCYVLRLFGARLGKGVNIKPRVRVKFPWRLSIGSHSWIGEGVWIDNLAEVSIGANCCISQNVYFCTGNHDWSREDFALITGGIVIGDGAWIAAGAIVGPGVTVGANAILALGSVTSKDVPAEWIYRGNPAQPVKPRVEKKPD